jgi:hypothetical protein
MVKAFLPALVDVLRLENNFARRWLFRVIGR